MRMPLFFALFLTLNFSKILAQELVSEFTPKDTKAKLLNLLLANQKDDVIGLGYTTPRTLVIQSIGKDGQLLYQKDIPGQWEDFSPLGTLYDKDNYLFFFYNQKTMRYLQVTAGKTEESLSKVQVLAPFSNGDEVIGNMVSNNEWYAVGWNKQGSQLKVARYAIEQKSTEVKTIALNKALSGKFAGMDQIVSITETTLPEPSVAQEKRKIYLLPGGKQIAITIDGKNYDQCQTELIVIDWEKSTVELMNMGLPVRYSGVQMSTNSYIYDKYLAMFRVEPDFLHLMVHDLETKSVLKDYKFSNNDTLNIMNSRMFTESESYSVFTDTREFSKEQTRIILRKLSKGRPFVFFEPTSKGQMIFTAGNYIEQSSGGGFSPGMPGFSTTTPYGVVSSPGTPGSFQPYGKSYQLSRYFYSTMVAPTFDHQPGSALDQQFLSKKLKDFVEKHITANSGRLFSPNPVYDIFLIPGAGYALVVNYLKKEDKIKVYRIDL